MILSSNNRKRASAASARLILVLVNLLVCFVHSPFSQDIVILPDDEPLMNHSQITRGELAEIVISYFPRELLVRLSAGSKIPKPGEDPDTVWKFLNSSRLIPAFSNGNNYPDDIVTRGQMAILFQNITRLFPVLGTKNDITFESPHDVDKGSFYARPVREVLLLGLMSTDSLGMFETERPLTGREAVEGAAAVNRLMKVLIRRTGSKTP